MFRITGQNLKIGLLFGALFSFYYIVVNVTHQKFYQNSYSTINEYIDIIFLILVPLLLILHLSRRIKKPFFIILGCCALGLFIAQIALYYLLAFTQKFAF